MAESGKTTDGDDGGWWGSKTEDDDGGWWGSKTEDDDGGWWGSKTEGDEGGWWGSKTEGDEGGWFGSTTDDGKGGWWGNLVTAAKQQTEKVYDMVSQDLTEFTSTMQADTKQVVEKTKETLQTGTEGSETQNATDRMKQNFHSLMAGITKVLTVSDPEDTLPPIQVSHPATAIFDRAKARMRAVQVDTGTYLQEPSGPSEKYADWLRSFDLDANKGEISDLLVTMVEVRSLYTSLVPSEVSHQDFWRRYFYKVHQLQVDEARKQALMKRAERADVKEDSIGWDEEEEWSGAEDATPSKKSPPPVQRADPSSRLQSDAKEEVKVMSHKPLSDGEDTDSSNTSIQDTHIQSDTQSSESQLTGTKLKQLETKENVDGAETQSIKSDTNDIYEGIVDGKSETQSIKSDTNIINEEIVDGESETQTKGTKDSDNVDDAIDVDKSDKFKTVEKEKPSLARDQVCENIEPEQEIEGVKRVELVEDKQPVKNLQNTETEKEVINKETENEESSSGEKELQTAIKGDMVVVGDTISTSSESSANKESSNEEWERDFDVDVTPEDLAAASELAQKMNVSASECNQLTAEEEDDWENWD